jgi:hypothetical protein
MRARRVRRVPLHACATTPFFVLVGFPSSGRSVDDAFSSLSMLHCFRPRVYDRIHGKKKKTEKLLSSISISINVGATYSIIGAFLRSTLFSSTLISSLFHFTVMQLVRLAGCWWLVLIYFERAILLAGCWWLVCPEKKKVLLAGG